jgi:hypothetical protein
MDFLQKVETPSKAQKHKRPSGEDTAESSTFFKTIQNKDQDIFLFTAYFIKRRKKPVTGFCVPTLLVVER